MLTGVLACRPSPAQITPDSDILGVYFDPEATQTSVQALPGTQVQGYLSLTNPSHTGPITGWECRLEHGEGLYLTTVTLSGDGLNLDTAPSFFVGVGRLKALPTDDVVILATLTWLVSSLSPAYVFLHPHPRPTLAGRMIYVAGDEPCDYRELAWPYGLETSPVAVVNGPPLAVPEPATPETFCLYQNVPNPFNPQTAVRFDLPEPARVHLAIYDLAGRLVKRLVDGVLMEAGKHEALWTGRDDAGRPVAAGVYVLQLRAGDDRQTRRLVLLR